MHRTIGYLSKRFAYVRPGEGPKVLLTFGYFFLVITAYYVVKPVSRSLMLDDLGHRMVPYADLLTAILMGPVVSIFARLVDYVSKPRLVSLAFGAVTAVTVLFWGLLRWLHPWVAGAFYIWVSIFSVLVVTMFWLVANDLYRPRDAKRLFGFIGSGGMLGGLVGSAIAAVGAQLIGTENLLLLSAGLLAVCWLVVRALWGYAPEQAVDPSTTLAVQRHETFLSNLGAFLRMLASSRFLCLLVAVVCVSKIVGTLIFYQFNPFIEQTFPDLDAKTTFTGFFFGGINVLAFVVQFFFTSWILRRWGLLVALLILPLGVLLGTGALCVAPIFWIASGTELFDRSMGYSLHNTAKEVLYLPIDRSVRYKVKPFIDMVVFRFGKGIAAIIGIILLDVIGVPTRWLSLVTIPLVVFWLVATIRVRGEYTMRIRAMLQAKVSEPTKTSAATAAVAASQPRGTTVFGSLAADRSPEEKLTLLQRFLAPSLALRGAPAQELLAQLRHHEDIIPPGTDPPSDAEVRALKAVVQDPAAPVPKRRQAIRWLRRRHDQDTLDYLWSLLLVEQDSTIRQEVAKALVTIRTTGRAAFQFPSARMRRQVAREVMTAQHIVSIAQAYRQRLREGANPDDPVVGLLRVLLQESVEQVFRLLMLVYRPEDIHLIYEQLRSPDVHARADAVELLDNLVDLAMRRTLFPILDEDRFLSCVDEPVEPLSESAVSPRVFQEAIWDHHAWLSVTAFCAVGRLRLTVMREELERAAHHTEPLVSTAAKLALELTIAL